MEKKFADAGCSILVAQDLCSPESTNKLNYGAQCNGSSECRTGVCSWSRCSCSSNSFYDDYSTSCVPKCGSNLYSDGLIASPAYLYSQDSTCYWDINGSFRTYVTLVVDDIDMYLFNCNSNYLTVTDSNNYMLVNKVCYRNYTTPNIVASSDYYMRINYVTSYSGYRGFRGKFYIRSYVTSLSELSGYIASPGFPVKYPNSSNYTWLISGKPGHVVTLSILSIDTECTYDIVSVYDGPSIHSPLLVSPCRSSVTRNITSSTSQMVINFRTDGSVQYTGFSALYVTHGRPYNQSCNDTGQCADNFTCIDSQCGCRIDQYYDADNKTCLNDVGHGVQCSVSVSGMCASYLNCTTDQSGMGRCLCPGGHYEYQENCFSDSELSVTIATETVIQTTSIYLKWTTVTRRSDVYYTITWVAVGNSTDRGYNVTYTSDTYMTNLKSATEYEMTITAILPSDNLYSSKYINSTFRIETRRPYGYGCSGNIQCDVRLNCIGGKCICLQNQYFQNSTSTCMTNVDESPVSKTPDGSNVQMTLIGLTCAGWVTSVVAMVIICVQCFRIRKITRHGCPKTNIEIKKQIQSGSEGSSLSEIKPVTTNNKREVPTSLGTVPPTSPINSVASFNSSIYVNDSYQYDALGEAKDNFYVEILHVSDDHLYNK
ncbi:hypothetical protein Btru_024610 [Bulinus truncatus]|nr:hypothetical protein Btru_024610 [Bulinus truncatus]